VSRSEDSRPERARTCAILAGGRGSRLGGGKPLIEVAGRPLVDHAVAIARAAGLEPVIVAKPDTDLGAHSAHDNEGAGAVSVVLEPASPSHPLLGIATGLEAIAEPLVVCPCDMPLLPPALLRALATTAGADPPVATVVTGPRGTEPLLGLYPPQWAAGLRAAAEAGASAHGTLEELGAQTVDAAELLEAAAAAGTPGEPESWLRNINTPDERSAVERLLLSRR
jgi:molybdopterin-guanine dinucleotide biosynthesis protein A